MKRSTKIFIAVGAVLFLVAMAEMGISVFFANQYAEQHGSDKPAIHLH